MVVSDNLRQILIIYYGINFRGCMPQTPLKHCALYAHRQLHATPTPTLCVCPFLLQSLDLLHACPDCMILPGGGQGCGRP